MFEIKDDTWQRAEMVEKQLRRRGIRDPAVLAAMLAVPRHEFVPGEFRARAYDDVPLPIGGGQTISQPYIVAAMRSEEQRLNSSHVSISYAVFCLKKKKNNNETVTPAIV